MPIRDIEEAMVNFAEGKTDVLLATNIIESGLDLPRANTMIVWRPELFGLAQLHQLRGRVGRSGTRAYAYFMSDPETRETESSTARLQVLCEANGPGAGLEISQRDLDLRGGGDPLFRTAIGTLEGVGARSIPAFTRTRDVQRSGATELCAGTPAASARSQPRFPETVHRRTMPFDWKCMSGSQNAAANGSWTRLRMNWKSDLGNCRLKARTSSQPRARTGLLPPWNSADRCRPGCRRRRAARTAAAFKAQDEEDALSSALEGWARYLPPPKRTCRAAGSRARTRRCSGMLVGMIGAADD